jgi:hypothetical protein
MKKLVLLSTHPLMLLTTLPIAVVLALSIYFNSYFESFIKLYPLIVVSALAIVFILLYLIRVVVISYDEVKIVGLFSSKDRAIINKDKTLIISQRRGRRLKVILFGNDGTRPALDWAQGDDFVPVDINLFKEIGYGGLGTIRRILRYFEVDENSVERLVSEERCNVCLDNLKISKTTVDGKFEYRILFLKTL